MYLVVMKPPSTGSSGRLRGAHGIQTRQNCGRRYPVDAPLDRGTSQHCSECTCAMRSGVRRGLMSWRLPKPGSTHGSFGCHESQLRTSLRTRPDDVAVTPDFTLFRGPNSQLGTRGSLVTSAFSSAISMFSSQAQRCLVRAMISFACVAGSRASSRSRRH
jgi:hypothetical protein